MTGLAMSTRSIGKGLNPRLRRLTRFVFGLSFSSFILVWMFYTLN